MDNTVANEIEMGNDFDLTIEPMQQDKGILNPTKELTLFGDELFPVDQLNLSFSLAVNDFTPIIIDGNLLQSDGIELIEKALTTIRQSAIKLINSLN